MSRRSRSVARAVPEWREDPHPPPHLRLVPLQELPVRGGSSVSFLAGSARQSPAASMVWITIAGALLFAIAGRVASTSARPHAGDRTGEQCTGATGQIIGSCESACSCSECASLFGKKGCGWVDGTCSAVSGGQNPLNAITNPEMCVVR